MNDFILILLITVDSQIVNEEAPTNLTDMLFTEQGTEEHIYTFLSFINILFHFLVSFFKKVTIPIHSQIIKLFHS